MTSPIEHRADLEWANKQLSRFTYKPNWSFTIDYEDSSVYWGSFLYSPFKFVGRFQAPDAREPDHQITVVAKYPLPENIPSTRDDALFDAWLKRIIWTMEQHEIEEWFKKDGELVNDPHK